MSLRVDEIDNLLSNRGAEGGIGEGCPLPNRLDGLGAS